MNEQYYNSLISEKEYQDSLDYFIYAFKLKPYKHQSAAFNFSKNLDQFALFMDMGTGKSLTVLMKTIYLFNQNKIDKLLVISPNYLKEQWLIDNCMKSLNCSFYKGFVFDQKIKTQKGKKEFDEFCKYKGLKIFSINIDVFQYSTIHEYLKQFINNKDIFIVVDESTIIKNPESKQTKTLLKSFENIPYKAILTGTATPNSTSDLWSQFEFLKHDFFHCNYYQFKHRYEIIVKGYGGHSVRFSNEMYQKIKADLSKNLSLDSIIVSDLAVKYGIKESDIIEINRMNEFSPYKNIDHLNKMIAPITFKCRLEDVADLPPKIYEPIFVEMNDEQERLYKELRREFVAYYDGGCMTIVNTAAFYIKFRMILSGVFSYIDMSQVRSIEDLQNPKIYKKTIIIKNSPKIKVLKEDIANVSPDRSIIIWGNYQASIANIYNELKDDYSVGTYYGLDTELQKSENDEKFRKKEIQIIIANPKSASMGKNWQISNLNYIFDDTYKADYRTQLEARTHRIGQTSSCVYKPLITRGTMEEKIQEVIKEKINLMDFFKEPENLKKYI
jgi:SNF2 family DNA or RNA helicase